jgi:hypothetical protein
MAQVTHPAGAIEVGICSRDCRLAHYARLAPIAWQQYPAAYSRLPQQSPEFGDQGKARSKWRKRLNKTRDLLSGSVENANDCRLTAHA